MIKYQYAIEESSSKLVHITDVTKASSTTYHCIACKSELIPKMGSINTHHFAHKNLENCSGETYLHLVGKQKFYDTYKQCVDDNQPFHLIAKPTIICNHYQNELHHTCDLSESGYPVDLTKHFPEIRVEKKEDSFIPDLVLIGHHNEEKIFIEIAVSHKSSHDKRSSGIRIIEFHLKNESDLNLVESTRIYESERIEFINFKKKEVRKSICQGKCRQSFSVFSIERNGQIVHQTMNLTSVWILKSKSEYTGVHYGIHGPFNPDNLEYAFKTEAHRFGLRKIQAIDCHLCKFHTDNPFRSYVKNYRKIYCTKIRIPCDSYDALKCEFFSRINEYEIE